MAAKEIMKLDAAYGVKGFAIEAERVAFLFQRYQLVQAAKPVKKPGKPEVLPDRA